MITNNATLDQAIRAIAMALDAHRATTGMRLEPEFFTLRVHPDTWIDWRAKADDIHPAVGSALFERNELMGFKIVVDDRIPPGRLVMRCSWETTVL